ncbi:MAG: glycine zipper domain-containing protein [Fusobacteriaceae bacterium]
MKKLLLSIIVIVSLTGCANAGSGAIGGTTVGAGTGAILGQAIGNDSKSTLIGAGIGAAAGALIGTMQDSNRIKQEQSQQQNYRQPQQSQPQYYVPVQPGTDSNQPKYPY